jgi:hypothetical protein
LPTKIVPAAGRPRAGATDEELAGLFRRAQANKLIRVTTGRTRPPHGRTVRVSPSGGRYSRPSRATLWTRFLTDDEGIRVLRTGALASLRSRLESVGRVHLLLRQGGSWIAQLRSRRCRSAARARGPPGLGACLCRAGAIRQGLRGRRRRSERRRHRAGEGFFPRARQAQEELRRTRDSAKAIDGYTDVEKAKKEGGSSRRREPRRQRRKIEPLVPLPSRPHDRVSVKLSVNVHLPVVRDRVANYGSIVLGTWPLTSK